MDKETFINISKKKITTLQGNTDNSVKLGCLQRIANSTELMASNYVRLQEALERYKKCIQRQDIRVGTLERSNAALRGVITKMKKKGVNNERTNRM